MSDADTAYARAQEIIAAAKLSGTTEITFNDEDCRALDTLPPEIAELTTLTFFDLRNTQVSDIAALAKMTALKTLSLGNTQVSNIAALENMTALKSLYLSDTQVSDITVLENMTALETLYLSDTQVSDIAVLENITALKKLYLENTQVTDIAALANMTALETLYLYNTQVSDIAALAGLDRLFRPKYSLEGVFFTGIPALEGDADLARVAEIDDTQKRMKALRAYFEERGFYDPPEIPDQTETGLRYAVGAGGQIVYDPHQAELQSTQQQEQLHRILIEDCRELALRCGGGGNQPFAVYGGRLDQYLSGLGDDLTSLQPVPLWSAGRKLRNMLQADTDRRSGDMSNTPKLDSDLRGDLDSFIAAHNAFSALHPDLATLDHNSIDPAERIKLEQNRVLMQAVLDAFAAQTRLIMTEVVDDLRDMLKADASATQAALRDLAVGQDSLGNLINRIVAQAIIETRDETFMSRIAGDVRSAAVGTVTVGGATILSQQDPAAFAQLVSSLQPQLAAFLSAQHGEAYPVKKAVEWVKARLVRAQREGNE